MSGIRRFVLSLASTGLAVWLTRLGLAWLGNWPCFCGPKCTWPISVLSIWSYPILGIASHLNTRRA